MFFWIGAVVKAAFYGLLVLFMAPVLVFLREDPREPTVDDGVDYDDPGDDVDE